MYDRIMATQFIHKKYVILLLSCSSIFWSMTIYTMFDNVTYRLILIYDVTKNQQHSLDNPYIPMLDYYNIERLALVNKQWYKAVIHTASYRKDFLIYATKQYTDLQTQPLMYNKYGTAYTTLGIKSLYIASQ